MSAHNGFHHENLNRQYDGPSHGQAPAPAPPPHHAHAPSRPLPPAQPPYNNSSHGTPYGSGPPYSNRRNNGPYGSQGAPSSQGYRDYNHEREFRDHRNPDHGPNHIAYPPYHDNFNGSNNNSPYNTPRHTSSQNQQRQHHSQFRSPQSPPSIENYKLPKNKWIYTKKELATLSPSVLDGMPYHDEQLYRKKGIIFIISVAGLLKLNTMVIYAASVFFHRFYLRKSLKRYHHYNTAATALFLATKVEESTRKLRDFTIACTKVASKNPKLVVDEQLRDFWQWKDTILANEEVLLEALTFDLTLESPFEMLSHASDALQLQAEIRKSAWAFVNDSCQTSLCIMFPTKVILAAAIQWALKFRQMKLPEITITNEMGEEKVVEWTEHPSVKVSKEDRTAAMNVMTAVYESGSNAASTPKAPVPVSAPGSTSLPNVTKRKMDSEEVESHDSKKPKADV